MYSLLPESLTCKYFSAIVSWASMLKFFASLFDIWVWAHAGNSHFTLVFNHDVATNIEWDNRVLTTRQHLEQEASETIEREAGRVGHVP